MRTLLLLLTALTIASCGRLKHTTSETDTTIKVQTESEVDEVVETTEKIDTLITLAPDTSSWSFPEIALHDSSELILETPRQSVAIRKDKAGNYHVRAAVKEVIMPVKMERKTTEKRKIREESKVKVRDKEYHEDKDREASGRNLSLVLFLALIITLIIVFRKV